MPPSESTAAMGPGGFIDREAIAVFESISDALVILDAGWRMVYLNREAARLNGKPADASIGRVFWDEWPQAAGSEIERQYRHALAAGSSVHFEHHYQSPEVDVWVRIDAHPFHGGLAVLYRDISGEKRAQRALRESEDLYRATFNSAAVGIAHVDLAGRWLRFNDAVCSITGYSRDELASLTFADITHPDDIETDWSLARRLAAGELPHYNLEKRYIQKSGAIVWVNLTVSLLRDGSGRLRHYISFIEDITRRKQAEADVRERDERLHGTIESISDAFMQLDSEWKFSYVNAAWERISGFSREQAIGKTQWELMPALLGTNLEEELRRAMSQRVPAECETFFEPWKRWFSTRAYPDKSGGITCFCRDITLQKNTGRALEQSEARYRSLVQATAAFVWTSDARGEFTQPQPQWEAYTGQSWDQYRGSGGGWTAAVHPEDRARVAEAWRRAVETTSHFEVEWRAWHAPSGDWRHCVTRGAPVCGDDGGVREWVGAVNDVHDRKLLEAKLQRQDKLDSLGILAGGVAHDFNNLLVGILANAAMAMEDAGPRARQLLEEVVRSSERAADLTRQMLAYAGRGELMFEPLDLSHEAREVALLLRSTLGPAARLELNLAEGLRPVRADRGQLQQILMNLLINASEALDEAGGRIRVETSLQDDAVVLTVQDDGKGMTSEVKERIFDPFFTTKFTGRGLGLAAVMGIVRAHNGTIEVDSMPGGGATFRIVLPASDEKIEPKTSPRRVLAARSGAMTVLVVDDETVVLRVVKSTLSREGMRVLEASSGQEGMRLFEQQANQIDLVILDATMPDVGGREVLQAMRRRRPGIPIIVSSGHPLAQVERYFGEDAPTAILPKPYRPEAWREVVASLKPHP